MMTTGISYSFGASLFVCSAIIITFLATLATSQAKAFASAEEDSTAGQSTFHSEGHDSPSSPDLYNKEVVPSTEDDLSDEDGSPTWSHPAIPPRPSNYYYWPNQLLPQSPFHLPTGSSFSSRSVDKRFGGPVDAAELLRKVSRQESIANQIDREEGYNSDANSRMGVTGSLRQLPQQQVATGGAGSGFSSNNNRAMGYAYKGYPSRLSNYLTSMSPRKRQILFRQCFFNPISCF